MICSVFSLKQIRVYASTATPKSHLSDFVDMVQNSLIAYVVVGTFIDAAYFDILYYFIGFIVIQKGILASELNEARYSGCISRSMTQY